MSNEEVVKRILNHYKKLLNESYTSVEEAISVYSETYHEVIRQLLPYALENNFWWEKKDINMAYYQLQNPILVVDFKTFKKYYHKLMGKRFDEIEFKNEIGRTKILKEAEKRFHKKAGR